jgi:hypothetical protein
MFTSPWTIDSIDACTRDRERVVRVPLCSPRRLVKSYTPHRGSTIARSIHANIRIFAPEIVGTALATKPMGDTDMARLPPRDLSARGRVLHDRVVRSFPFNRI